MRLFIGLLLAAAIIGAAIFVLGLIGPFVAGIGLLVALVVLFNPGGLGNRIRQSPGWWSIPGMRKASSRAAAFAAMIAVYAIPVPLIAFAAVHSAGSGTPSSAPVANVGGGSSATPAPTAPLVTVFNPTAAAATTAPTPTATPTPTPAPTPTAPPATPVPTAAPTAVPTAAPAPPPPPPPPPPAKDLCGAPQNPWGYNFCGGGTIASPPSDFCSYFNCIPSFWKSTNGYVEQCQDGTYSHSGGRSGSCSSHGGNSRPLNP